MLKDSKRIDFVVVGAGIIGINVALALKKKYPQKKVLVFEKEKAVGLHASGRNSGVLHAGFYYPADSLKAKFTKLGNQALTQYCEEKKLPINKCGKLVVAKDEADDQAMGLLLERAKLNQVLLEEMTLEQAKRIEPRVKSYRRVLYSPTTSTVDPLLVLKSLTQDAIELGVQILFDSKIIKINKNEIVHTGGQVFFDYLVNAAGLYSDQIAKKMGFAKDYRIMPFKGLYLYSKTEVQNLNCHIYPVPNLQNPFLGVHYTISVQGKIKIGPTAIPAFWREQYKGLQNFSLSEFINIVRDEISMFFDSPFQFRELAINEIKKYFKTKMIEDAGHLIEGVSANQFDSWGEPGIRAQLFNIKTKKLVMDFCIEKDGNSLHILNAVSPGFTCSIPFSEYIVSLIER